MPIPPNHVRLYETLQDIETSVPYATEDAVELSLVICRFVSWAQVIATHPNIAARFGDLSTAHIQLATDLRTAMKVSREKHLYPKVVLPMSKYFSAKLLAVVSQSMDPEIAELIEQELPCLVVRRSLGGVGIKF